MNKVLLFSLLIFNCLYTQNNKRISFTSTSEKSNIFNDSLKSIHNTNTEPLKIIVEFKEEPLFISELRSSGMKKSSAFYDQRFAEFSSSLGLPRQPNNTLNKTSAGITKEYYKAFFGVRVIISSNQVADVTSLPYVKAIHFDREVKAMLEKSIPQIGADQVWQTFGKNGEGVKVGIIDTGIDYLHPALGGGFGNGFKVAGGYDFVNSDSDPMDDNGHGTHVAGIVSANSPSLKGVAPESKLYAYKVLDKNGSGLESDIISAIERVVDPNDDGDMSDKLDVVNVSLGSTNGNPNDASSVAVNNASKLGVIFVIAAGNSGYRPPTDGKENNFYYNGSATIGSPGTAELAITVGAVDSIDRYAGFSSKGPNRATFGIKPEILAPGVQINSTFLGSATKRFNGTSMATPMVTGAVALLKSIYPEWTAERIKSSLINTAKDIGLSAYKQGGGRVRVFNAATGSSWSRPAILNLGLDDPSVSTWIRKDTIAIYNTKNTSQNYSTAVTGGQSGISITVSPSSFSVSSHDSTHIIVTTTVNNITIPIIADDIPLYSGKIAVFGSVDTLTIPWAFARATKLAISFNESQPLFIGTSSEYSVFSWDQNVNWISPTTVELYGYGKGTYDFYTVFSSEKTSKIVLSENVVLNNDNQTLNINSSGATIPLVYQSKDQEGQPLSIYPSTRKILVSSIPNWGDQIALFRQSSDTILVSPASARYTFRPIEYHFDPAASKSFHIAQYPSFAGFSSGKTFTNSASDYISQNFKFVFPPTAQQAMIIGEFFSYRDIDGIGYMSGIGIDIDTVTVVDHEYTFKGYFQRSLEPLNDVSLGFYTVNSVAGKYIDISTFPVMLNNDSVVAMAREYAKLKTVLHSPNGGSISFGDAPVHLITVWYNNWFGPNTFHFNAYFRGVHRETRYGDLNSGTYSLFDAEGNKLFTNPLDDFPREPKTLLPQKYTMVIDAGNFWLRNKKGKIRQTSEFNLGQQQASPPSITAFLILNNQGQPTNSFFKGDTGTLLFSVQVIDLITAKQVHPDSTKVWYRIHGTTEWKPLPVQVVAIDLENEGTILKANLSSALLVDSTAVDLRVFVKDSVGNSNDFVIAPALAVGNWISNDPNGIDEKPDQIVPIEFTVYQNYPNPFNPTTTIRFGIPQASSVQIEIFNILGQKVEAIHQGNLSAGFHNVVWNANVPSGVYFYRVVMTSADGSAKRVTQTKKMLLLR